MIYVIYIILFIILAIGFLSSKNNSQFEKSIKKLYRQSARWAAAAIQDNSEIIATLHANYAAGYLWAIKDICTSQEFKSITGVDFLEFEKKIVKIQDFTNKKLVEKCPSLNFIKDTVLLNAMYSQE